jgi:hypothetical protein
MNQIFPKLMELINKCEFFNKMEERNKFEDNVEMIIKECINNYKSYKNRYIIENYKIENINKEEFKVIVNELVPPKEYDKKQYPMLEYFMLTKYPNKQSFTNILKRMDEIVYKNKYPLISQLLFSNYNTEKLKYLSDFNACSNLLLNNYSLTISRREAKRLTLYNGNILKLNGGKNEAIIDKFIDIYNKFKDDAIYYKENKKMETKTLTKQDFLIYYLIDDYEVGYGMHIASLYQSFIHWQNSFLKPIADAIAKNKNYNFYSNDLEMKIPIQDAKDKHILSIDEEIFENKIIQYATRDIITDKKESDYLNYNWFNYDFDLIENELGKLFLYDKCSFKEESLKFMIYKYENNSKILTDFYKNYSQKKLSDEERTTFLDFFERKYNNNNYKEFFDTLLLLFFYLNDNQMKEEETIDKLLDNIKNSINISISSFKEFRSFFQQNEITINKLYDIFVCGENNYLDKKWEDILENLNDKFKKDIKEKEKIKIKLNNYKNIKNLIEVIKRYVLRFLIITEDNESLKNIDIQLLIPELGRSDLWAPDVDKNKNLNDKFGEFNLTVGQIYNFYNIIKAAEQA